MIEKFFEFKVLDSSLKVYNENLNIYAPHHVPQSTDEEFAQYTHLKYYVSWNNTKEKVRRRFHRFMENIMDTTRRPLFLFTNFDLKKNEDINELIEVQRLLCQVREKNSFKLVFVDINFTIDKQEILKTHDIDYHPIDRIDVENYLILPTVGLLMINYEMTKV
jgi:hypothetical protein